MHFKSSADSAVVMPIGEVARRARLRASAIRYYERIGLLPRATRQSGRRRYGNDVLVRLRMIQFARESGFTLREMRQLLDGRPYSLRLRELAGKKLGELDAVIARARTMQSLLRTALRCRCLTIEECSRRLSRSSVRLK